MALARAWILSLFLFTTSSYAQSFTIKLERTGDRDALLLKIKKIWKCSSTLQLHLHFQTKLKKDYFIGNSNEDFSNLPFLIRVQIRIFLWDTILPK